MRRLVEGVSLGWKIALGPVIVSVLLCIVVAVSTVGATRTRAVVQEMSSQKLPRIAEAGSIAEGVAHANSMFMRSLAWEGVGLKAETIAELDLALSKELDSLEHRVVELKDPGSPDASDLQRVHEAIRAYRQSVKDTLDMKSMGLASAYGVMSRSERSYAELRSTLASMTAADLKAGEQNSLAAVDAARTTTVLLACLAAVAVACSILVTWLTVRATLIPLRSAVDIAKTVASGDLSSYITEPKARDETGELVRALKGMNAGLRAVVERVRINADSIATGSSEIASGNADLSRRTEQQASSLQQTAAAMEQLSSTVKNNAHAARDAVRLANSACGTADRGREAVTRVVQTMDAINSASRQIAEIVGAIDGIAFQTNILALNASVEAARAGEQGRGFAVVANEVRALAKRSADAAQEIRTLIQTNAQRVESGSSLVEHAGTTMTEIVADVKRVSVLISEIHDATDEQARGIEEIAQAVTSLDQVTQQNAALVEQSAAASESLQIQANQLVSAVGSFTLEPRQSAALRVPAQIS